MNIKQKLAFRSTLVSAVTSLIVCACTLFFFNRYSISNFYRDLGQRALIAGIIYLERDELNKAKYQEYERDYDQRLENEQVQIYDEANRVAFVPALDFPVTEALLNQIRATGKLNFERNDRYYSGIFYRDNQGDFVIIASALDIAGQRQLQNLALLLLIFVLLGLLINYLLNVRVARQTFSPLAHILSEVNSISAQSLDSRLEPTSATPDEMYDLVTTFNMFLGRLENEVNNQKQFLKNVSHELNTPLTAIIGQAEISLEKERSPEEYQHILQKISKDTYSLKSIIEGLMLMSGLNTSAKKPANTTFRMDELIWEVLEKLKYKYPNAVIHTSLEVESEDEHLLEVTTQQHLLSTALLNVVDNALKYSTDYTAELILKKEAGRLVLLVLDNGPGIPASEVGEVFELFYRGSNVKHIPGHGIGLSITRQILQYCGIGINVMPGPTKGSVFKLTF